MKILILGDTHFPFASRKAIEWAVKLAHTLKPTHIVQLGDLYDQFAHSRYPKTLKLTSEAEMVLARSAAERLWSRLPQNCRRVQMVGNHDDRIMKRVLEKNPEIAFLIGNTLKQLYTFENVELVRSYEYVINDIIFQHGHRSRLGDHAKYNQGSTVCGHSHVGGVVFMRNRLRTYFELNAGFLGDTETAAFAYRAQKLVNNTTLGVGVIDALGPRFIPYPG